MSTGDKVTAVLTIGALAIGLISMLVGKIVEWKDGWTVKHSQAVMSPTPAPIAQTDQTDKQTDPVSAADEWLDRVEVDRTRTAIIELMVYSGWQVGEIRSVVKGDNGAIGTEVEAARKKLGIAPEPPRMLRVRDNGSPERLIPMEE